MRQCIASSQTFVMGLRVARLLPAPAAAGRLAGTLARPPLPATTRQPHSWRGSLLHATSSSGADAAGTTAAAAVAATAPSVVQVASLPATPGGDAAVLSTADLQRFMAQRGIAAQVVPPLNGAPPPPACLELKSLVFLAGGQPLVSATAAC